MKKFGGLLFITLVLAGAWLSFIPLAASAATCANVSSFGAVSLQVPTLPKAGEYLVWVRLQSPETNGKVLVELNNADCLEVGSTMLTANTWTWQSYQQNGEPHPVMLNYTKGNILKIIGIQAGVKVDRVLLTDLACTPVDFGDNCVEAIAATSGDAYSTVVLPPPTNEPVSGKIILSNTPFTNGGDVSRLTYSTSGRTVQSADRAQPFDTARLANGKYTILIETTLISGKIIRESTIITINNPENVLSPLLRWARQHQNSLSVIGITAGTMLLSLLLFIVFRTYYFRRRERHFHGF